MKHSVHCEQTSDVNSLLDQHFPLGRTLAQPRGSPAGLCPAMDWSTHTFVQRRLLAQKLLERSHASKALIEALDGPSSNRDAALVILLHCCKLNSTLSQACIKAGLIRRLFHLVNSADMNPVAKVRCSYQGINPLIPQHHRCASRYHVFHKELYAVAAVSNCFRRCCRGGASGLWRGW